MKWYCLHVQGGLVSESYAAGSPEQLGAEPPATVKSQASSGGLKSKGSKNLATATSRGDAGHDAGKKRVQLSSKAPPSTHQSIRMTASLPTLRCLHLCMSL